jgi:hypothetical protein
MGIALADYFLKLGAIVTFSGEGDATPALNRLVTTGQRHYLQAVLEFVLGYG